MTISIENIKSAFELEDKFSQYRVVRSWGTLLIGLGILIVAEKLISLLLDIAQFFTQNNARLVEFFTDFRSFVYPFYLLTIFIILPIFLIAYTFFSIKKLKIDVDQISKQNVISYGIIMFLFHPLAFLIPFIFSFNLINVNGISPTNLIGRVSVELLSFSFSCFIAYFFLIKTIKDYDFKELLVLTSCFLVLSSVVFIYHFMLEVLNIGWSLIDVVTIPESVIGFPFLTNLFYLIILLLLFIFTGYTTRKNSTSFYYDKPLIQDTNESTILEKEDLILPDNQLFFSQVRFTILLILSVHSKATFSELQKLLLLTPGRLDYHLNKLVEKEFISRKKTFISQRALTVVEITSEGKDSFKNYLAEFEGVISKLSIPPS